MKIALSLSGNFKKYKLTLPSIVKFCNKFNIDIYLLIDYSENKEDIKKVINICKPRKVKYIKSLHDCSNINMWYKIKESYKLAKSDNIKYDYYIRARYDLLLDKFSEFKLSDLNMYKDQNVLFVGQLNYFFPIQKFQRFFIGFLSDEFFIGNKKIMDIYSNFYDVVINSNNRCLELYVPEIQFKHLSILYNTKIVNLKIFYRYPCYSDLDCFYYHLIKKNYLSTYRYIFWNMKYIIILITVLILIVIYK